MGLSVKQVVKRLINLSGYEVFVQSRSIGSDHRPVGRMDCMLEDLAYRGLQCTAILDVGANQTHWSRLAKTIFPDATLYMVEPQREMQEHLEQFCHDFPGSKYFLAGAGSNPGKAVFTVWDDLEGSSCLPETDPNLLASGKQRLIEIITIDTLIEQQAIEVPQLLKLDVQGFELEVLRGANALFGQTEIFILEVSLFAFADVPGMPVFADVISFMLDRNYVVYDFPGFLRRPYDGALGQCDICFVKQNSFLRASHQWSR
jgi:FkbM family methyltransferase